MKTKKRNPKKKIDADDKPGFAKDFNKRAAALIKKEISKNPGGKAS